MIILDNSLEKKNIQKLFNTLINNDNKITMIEEFYSNPKYNIYYSINVYKIIFYTLEKLCQNYLLIKRIKPHIIITNYESPYLYRICKQLLAMNMIELSIILDNFNIIESIKLQKRANTFICIISPINIPYGIINNMNKIYNLCKYYKILLLSDIYNNYTNLHNYNYYIQNQDIICLNEFSLKYKTQNIQYYRVLINKNISLKFDDTLVKVPNVMAFYNHLMLKNIQSLKKNYVNNIQGFYAYVITALSNYYNTIPYKTFKSTKNPTIYLNYCTIIVLNYQSENPLYNHLILSIYMPSVKFSNNQLITYFKNNNIILHTKYFIMIKDLDKHILKGLIHIQFDIFTKTSDVVKFVKFLLMYVSELENSNKINKLKSKKKVKFVNPEQTIPVIIKKNTIKSILKK